MKNWDLGLIGAAIVSTSAACFAFTMIVWTTIHDSKWFALCLIPMLGLVLMTINAIRTSLHD
jgi:hypothetical protein